LAIRASLKPTFLHAFATTNFYNDLVLLVNTYFDSLF